MSVHVVDDDMRRWVISTLAEMNEMRPITTFDCPCPHCGIPVRRPLVVSRHDVEMIERFMAAISEVADRHGITAHLLAEVKTQCMIAKVQKNAAGRA